MRSLPCGLVFAVAASTLVWAQPPEKLAAVYRAGRAVAAASQANLSASDARSRFSRAVSAFAAEIKVAQGAAMAPAEKRILDAYSLAKRKFEVAATSFEQWAASDEKVQQTAALRAAVPATRGGVEGKIEILDTLNSEGQQAAAEANRALMTATVALREGKENLAKAERAYLGAGPR